MHNEVLYHSHTKLSLPAPFAQIFPSNRLSKFPIWLRQAYLFSCEHYQLGGNDSNLLIVFYVQIMPDDFVMQLHRF
ncbi:hypothetical protein BFD45_20345 [Escherichia coli]|nr:hypothetical protein BFD45_20345 [Escherichia coli]